MRNILRTFIVLALAGQIVAGATLQGKIDQILSGKDVKNVLFSITIIDPQTGNPIYTHNSNMPLTPASNMKLVTSFTTFKTLGADYKFVTKAALVGNKLVIIGGGDPLLGLNGKDFIGQIVSALKAKNITQLDGVVVDNSIFDNERINLNWPKGQLNRAYSVEIAGLNYNGNCIKINAAVKGNNVILTKEPETEFVKLVNNVKIAKGESAIGSNRTEQENSLVVFGKCGKPCSFEVGIENPSIFTGAIISEGISKAGITVANAVSQGTAADNNQMQIIAQSETPIVEVLDNCNKDSLQIAAECMLKTLAAKTSGKQGSWQGGREAVGNYLMSLGVDKSEFTLDDGSGLSSVNKLSSNAISKVLMDAYKNPNWETFKSTLAIGGVDGTIKKQFYKEKYKNKVHAKTGYINGVRALSGVCTAQSGKDYLFSIITNKSNFPAKKAIYDIVEAVMDGN